MRFLLPTVDGRRRVVNVDIEEDEKKYYLSFRYDREMVEEVKVMGGARWNPDKREWSIDRSSRNIFQLAYLRGENPYEWYDRPLITDLPDLKRPLWPHQVDMTLEGLTYHRDIWGAEMGVGKTLSAIEVIERSELKDWWWIGTRSSLAQFELELDRWGISVYPAKIMTYDGLVKLASQSYSLIPEGIIFDECSKLKTATTKRSQAAKIIADAMRNRFNDPYIIGMSGTPAPKSPVDWWSPCEIICPGFIREGSPKKFMERLGLIVKKENVATGGIYPERVTWWDDVNKCGVCGKHKDTHDLDVLLGPDPHGFRPSVNEVEKLYKRLKGLVVIKMKKDCLSHLPEKNYRIIKVEPTKQILNLAKIIVAKSTRAITALTLLRELSDGFQYKDVETGTEVCDVCFGKKTIKQPIYGTDEWVNDVVELEMIDISCPQCSGTGEVPTYTRGMTEIKCPKDDALLGIMEDHEEDKRLVIYAGFKGSLDRIQRMVLKEEWDYIRVDGQGWKTSTGARKPSEMLSLFQSKDERKIAFIGQPSSAGIGLTLTASSEIVYYSNDFNPEARTQSEDRIHRPGMDINKGATITDITHLPSDLHTLNILKENRKLMLMSMGQLREALSF